MAHYARVNSDNIVIYVTPVSNEIITDSNDTEQDELALSHLYESVPESIGDRWIKTSYNNNFRKNYASIGYSYDENLDAFIPPKPFNSWVLNEQSGNWEAPIPMPEMGEDGIIYQWDDEIENWMPTY